MVQGQTLSKGKSTKICTVPNCGKKAHARGLCDKHRTQIRRHGRLTPERELGRPRPKVQCKVEFCTAISVARGLCSRHYSQMRRHGKILPDRRKARRQGEDSFFDLLEDLEIFGHGLHSATRPKHTSSHDSVFKNMKRRAKEVTTRQESIMGSRVSKHITRLLGTASVDVSERRPSLIRSDLEHSDQRLLDSFRLFHAHRLGGTDFRSVSKIAGFTEEQCQTWLSVSESAAPVKETEAGFAGRRESVDFAWLLGLYAAVRRSPAGKSPRPLRVRLDLDEANELSAKMKTLFGRAPSVRKVDDQYDVFFGSKELSRYLHDITYGNTQVPWEHLVTPAERKAFLASFLKRRCSLSAIGGVRPILAIGKRMAPSLRNGLLFLFAQLGIYPAFDDSRIFLQALPELQKVLEVGLIASEERSDRLARLVKHAPYDSLDIEVDLYYRVLAGEDSERVPAETRRRWFLDELPPKIKRVERIAALLADSPDPEVVGFLFRGFNMLPTDARELAKSLSLQQILGIISTLKRAKIPRDNWNQWITLSPEEISQKLGGERSPKIHVDGQVFRLSPRARMRYLQAYGLQPSEYEDFSICLEHIEDELRKALINSPAGGRVSSKSLVFSLQGNEIQSIRLVSHG